VEKKYIKEFSEKDILSPEIAKLVIFPVYSKVIQALLQNNKISKTQLDKITAKVKYNHPLNQYKNDPLCHILLRGDSSDKDVAKWVEKRTKFTHYASNFIKNKVRASILRDATVEDLQKFVGIENIVDCTELRKAIQTAMKPKSEKLQNIVYTHPKDLILEQMLFVLCFSSEDIADLANVPFDYADKFRILVHDTMINNI